ncbi:ABC transporter permease [Rhodococcus globerulus]|uniref:ABC transporter permease n=1 Tax=Rhodococcus globerulus TaxID=33008 RepID=A0ABU4C5E0_RHOGO|nr:ABC transporter permease [Rhodococcus globerulus]MDV6271717.1 ABC transporter permease [Rhodococcus globerulus]
MPPWIGWFVRRVVSGVAAVGAISVIVFAATTALPSDPARTILGPDARPEAIATLQEKLGLNDPIWEQYLRWLGSAVRLDFGVSLDSTVPITTLVGGWLANTLSLLFVVLLFTVPLALGLGVYAAVRRDSWVDRLVVNIAVFFKAIPAFVVAVVLVLVFATSVFDVLPAASLLDPKLPALAQPQYLVLPAITLIVSAVPYLLRQVRASVVEVLESEYVLAAELRGNDFRSVLTRHVLPNALVPAIQALALTLSVLVGGTIVVEVAFSYPGIGSGLEGAVGMRDVPVIQACVLVIAAAVVVINLAADLATVLVTPRLRTASGANGIGGRSS